MPFGRGHGYGYAPNLTSTYAGSSAGSRAGNLPDVPLSLTRRHRPPSGLQLTVTAVPNIGTHPHIPTTPRERERPGHNTHRLSSSDSKTLESLRPDRSHHRRNTSDDRLLMHRDRSPKTLFGEPFRPPALMPIPGRLPSSHPYRTLPPIAPDVPSNSEADLSEEHTGSEEEGETESLLGESEEEIFSDEVSDAPPSRPGFESDAEQSAQTFGVPFPDVTDPSTPFPATIIQDNAQQDQERFAASAHPSGLSTRVDNIVRAFQIHGPLDRELLSKALNNVASLHPLLSATFQQSRDRLYIQTSHGKVLVNLESPIVGYESPQDLVTNARRKIFPLTIRSDLVANEGEGGEDLSIGMSLASLEVHYDDPSDKIPVQPNLKKKSVSFANPPQDSPKGHATPLPALKLPGPSSESSPLLVRARLVSKSTQEHILVLSFPRVICDYWSSCLFVQQLTDAYSQLQKSSSYRPGLAALRVDTKKQALFTAHARVRGGVGCRVEAQRGQLGDATSRLQKKVQMANKAVKNEFIPAIPAQLHFQQVAQREHQLLKMMPKEKLWAFWESMVTATIRRQRGPNRIKVVPPVRIPSGLGERVARVRPQTSRFRPLTASRNRPQTAKRQSGVFGEMGVTREALTGPPTLFHFIKVEEVVCSSFRMSLPEEHLTCVKEEEVLSLMCLGAFVLMLGKCCRGWGSDERREKGRSDGASESVLHENSSKVGLTPATPLDTKPKKRFISDPLQQYKMDSRYPRTIVVPSSPLRRANRAAVGGRLDLGSFLIGVEVSLRDCVPQETVGLFGPLTNNVGIRVNLSSCETFADLIIALGRSLQLARNHGHFPFSTVADEVGLINGLPIKFSFLHHRSITQLTNPDNFYFTETAMGVKGHGLARFGSHCYLTPLSTKMDDSCYLELLLWEGYEAECVGGGFRYQPQVIRTELVEAFGSELCRLLSVVAEDPCKSLLELASEIRPPFLSSTKMRKSRRL